MKQLQQRYLDLFGEPTTCRNKVWLIRRIAWRLQARADGGLSERVRTIFELYLEHGSLLPVVHDLDRRGWRIKSWTTRHGSIVGGKHFTRTSLYQLLTNVVFLGKVRYKTETHPGEHEAIVDEGI
jgi:hypothetical protein